MRIVIASDHGAVERKEALITHLEKKGMEVVDRGVRPGEKADYPDVAQQGCQTYLEGGYDFGILLCGTGIGISIAANKVKGIRCALIYDLYSAAMAKKHNDANFVALGGRSHYTVAVSDMVDRFMEEHFEGGRHVPRLDKIAALEMPSCKTR